MNYEKIEALLQQKGISKMKFYETVSLTHTGFSRMMKNKTITVETLEKIAAYFDVGVSSFFDENVPKVATVQELQAKVSELYEENRELLKENNTLKDAVRQLEKNSTLPIDVSVPKLRVK